MANPPANRASELRGVVAVGASAGGVEALTEMAAGLPEDLSCAVLMVLHMSASAPSVLARIIDRSGPLPAQWATDDCALRPGRIYVGSPDRHLLVADHRVVLSKGPTEHGHRPAINALFRSVAVAFGARAVGVAMSGVLDDGVAGAAPSGPGVAPRWCRIPATPCSRRCRGTPYVPAWPITGCRPSRWETC